MVRDQCVIKGTEIPLLSNVHCVIKCTLYKIQVKEQDLLRGQCVIKGTEIPLLSNVQCVI